MKLFVPKDEAPGASAQPRPDVAGTPKASAGLARPGRKPKAARKGGRGAIPEPSGVAPSELAERRDTLANEFAELQWDLGGLVYEMAARDHFRLDVVVRRAAKLQAVDAELAEVDRLLRLEDAGAAGNCPACGALYARGAAFCWQCGKDLLPQGSVSTEQVGAPPQRPATPAESVGAKAAAAAEARPPTPATPPPQPAAAPPHATPVPAASQSPPVS